MLSLEKVELHVISLTPGTESLIFPCLILGLLNSDSKSKLYIRHRIRGKYQTQTLNWYDHRKPKLTILGELMIPLNFPLQQRSFSAAEDRVTHTVIIIVCRLLHMGKEHSSVMQEQHIVHKHMLRPPQRPSQETCFLYIQFLRQKLFLHNSHWEMERHKGYSQWCKLPLNLQTFMKKTSLKHEGLPSHLKKKNKKTHPTKIPQQIKPKTLFSSTGIEEANHVLQVFPI